MNSTLCSIVGKNVAQYIMFALNDDVIPLIVSFIPKHPCSEIIKDCRSMSQKMIDMSTNDNTLLGTSVFDGIRDGLFDLNVPDTADRWLQFNPSVVSHFVGCRVLIPSVDFRPKNAVGCNGRKGPKGRKNFGKGQGRVVESVYRDAQFSVSQMREYRATTPNVPDVYRL